MNESDDKGGNLPLNKTEQDRTDLNNEMAGREVGRINRFLPEDASPAALKKRNERHHERLSALMALLRSDPEYAALHNNAMETLRRHEIATERALADAIKRGDQKRADELRRYQVEVLGHARDRLTDEDNPPTKEEIEELTRGIEARAKEVNIAPDADALVMATPGTPSVSVSKPDL